MSRYFLYRHVRLDTNEVFYVGMGTKPKVYSTWNTEYKRAYTTMGRNPIWSNVVSKTEYTVEILFESNDKDFIKQKEKEFVKLYGRKKLGKGSLVNLTAGGDGSLGVVVSNATKKKMSEASTAEIRKRAALRLSKKCFHVETGKEFSSLKEGCEVMNESYGAQKMAIQHKRTTAKFMFIGEEFEPIKRKRAQARGCIYLPTGEIYPSLSEGCRVKGLKYSQQQDALKLNLTTKLFKWAEHEI